MTGMGAGNAGAEGDVRAEGKNPLPPAIDLIGIDKSFGPVHANRAVSLRVDKGTIHGIIGENGAGKSTLMSILYGFYEADAGRITVGGRDVRIRNSNDAIAAGIGAAIQLLVMLGHQRLSWWPIHPLAFPISCGWGEGEHGEGAARPSAAACLSFDR